MASHKGKITVIICAVLLFAVLSGSASFGSVESLDAEGKPDTGSVWDEELPDIPEETLIEGRTLEYRTTAAGKEYLLIRPSSEDRNDVLCFILIPEAEDREEFLEYTEWDMTASLEKIRIVCCQTDWNDTESADAYLDEIYNELTDTDITDSTSVFISGYDEAADYALQEALMHTERYAGIVAFGGEGLSEEMMSEYSDNASEDHAISVWVFSPKKTIQISDNIKFWKTWNGIENSEMTTYDSTFSDELYLPMTSSTINITDNKRMGAVLFSRCEDYRDPSVGQDVATYFFTSVKTDEISFRESITGGEIVRINDLSFSYHRKQMDGQQRDYWTYIPESAVFSDEPCSLIICLHGNGGFGEDMIFRSMWHNVAADNSCIVIYPSSLYINGTQHYWMDMEEELDFIRVLTEETCQRFSIDRTHIYVTGFSNGAGMAQDLAMKCSDIFAAAVMSAPAYFDEEYMSVPFEERNPVAVMYTYGSEDEYMEAFEMSPGIDGQPAERHMEYWRGIYGFEHDSYQVEKDGRFNIYTYYSINNIPVCQWILVDGKNHDYPEEEVAQYFEFMKHFSKAETGELYYDGQLVETIS